MLDVLVDMEKYRFHGNKNLFAYIFLFYVNANNVRSLFEYRATQIVLSITTYFNDTNTNAHFSYTYRNMKNNDIFFFLLSSLNRTEQN
jgi:hypothetical protein